MTSEPPDLALTTLIKRWEADPSTQLSLQLAEEHRRRQEIGRAIRVLRVSLENHPRHVASRVALGRYLLQSGAATEARDQLERITAEDPTHLVANKLLVKTHLELGDRKNARERLDLYTLLNDGDPEIEELEIRLSGGPGASSVEVPSETPHSRPESVRAEPPPEPKPDPSPTTQQADEVFALPASAAPRPTGSDLFASAWEAVPRQEQLEPEVAREPVAPPAVAEAAAPETEEVTVTLGTLYLAQGHRGEARRVFQAILEREPDNPAARIGLRSAESDRAWSLTAVDLLTPDRLAVEEPEEWKRSLLTAYLDRVKQAAAGA